MGDPAITKARAGNGGAGVPAVVPQTPGMVSSETSISVGNVFGMVPRTMRLDFESGASSMATLFAGRESCGASISQLETDIQNIKQSLASLTSDDRLNANRRLTQLGKMRDLLKEIGGLEIQKKDVLDLRRYLVSKIMLGRNGRFADGETAKLQKCVDLLKRWSAVEKQREDNRGKIKGLYFQNPRFQFKTDYWDVHKYELDEYKDPKLEKLNEQSVIKAYNYFKNSADEKDQETSVLFANLVFGYDCESRGETIIMDGISSFIELESRVNKLEETFGKNGIPKFLEKVEQFENEATKDNPTMKAKLAASESLAMLSIYPNITRKLDNFLTEVLLSASPAGAREFLKITCAMLIDRGEKLKNGLDPNAFKDIEPNFADIQSMSQYLASPEAEKIGFKELNELAQRLSQSAKKFSLADEMLYRVSIAKWGVELSKLTSAEDNITPIYDALREITLENTPDPEKRLEAYKGVAEMIEKASMLRLIDARIDAYSKLLKQTAENYGSANVISGMTGGRGGMLITNNMLSILKPYEKLCTEYKRIRGLIASSDEGERQNGLLDLQRLETAAIHDSDRFKNDAAIGNAVRLFLSVSTTFCSLGITTVATKLIGLGLSRILSGLALRGSLFLTSVTTFTASNRGLNALAFGSEALEGSFLGEFFWNLATFGGVGLVLKGAGALANKGLEIVAKRALAARGGALVIEGAAAGNAAVTGEAAYKAALEAEKARILEKTWMKFAKTAGTWGSELATFQTIEHFKAVGELEEKGVKQVAETAWDHLCSFVKAQAKAFGMLLVMKAMNHGVESFMGSVDVKINNAYVKIEFGKRARQLAKDWETFRTEFGESVTSGRLSDDDLLASVRKAQDLLNREQEMLGWKHSQEPSPENEQQWIKNQQALDAMQLITAHIDGVRGLVEDGNPFGIRANENGGYLYDRSKASQIVAAARRIPWVRVNEIAVGRDGTIQIPMGPTPFMEARLIELSPARPQPEPVRSQPRPVYATATP